MTEKSEKSCELHLIRTSEMRGGEIVMILEETTDDGDVFYKVVNLDGHKYVVNHSFLNPLLEGELFNRIRKMLQNKNVC